MCGNIPRSEALIPEVRAQDAEMYTNLFKRGVQFLRVRAVELPLSKYLEWEFKTYHVTALYGESILVTSLMGEPDNGPLWTASDYLLFDSLGVLIHDYGHDGVLTGGWLVRQSEFISSCEWLAKEFIAKSVPLAVFERSQSLA